jgi:class 3 adenylate cyclase
VTTGDGLLATFAAPAAAVRFGQELQRTMDTMGLAVRIGAHTAEVEVLADDTAGVGVHIGARVAALAEPGEVWVTRTAVSHQCSRAGATSVAQPRGPVSAR